MTASESTGKQSGNSNVLQAIWTIGIVFAVVFGLLTYAASVRERKSNDELRTVVYGLRQQVTESERSIGEMIDAKMQQFGEMTDQFEMLSSKLKDVSDSADSLESTVEKLEALTPQVDQMREALDGAKMQLDETIEKTDQLLQRINTLKKRFDEMRPPPAQ